MIENVAFIPLRAGSKGIPGKNIRKLNGKPLCYWAIKAAHNCKYIDRVYVSTDGKKIRKTVEKFGFEDVRVIDRSPEVSTDTASTESTMLEFANNFNFENICLIQATSPLVTKDDLEGGFTKYLTDNLLDSVVSVSRKYWLVISEHAGRNIPLNFNPAARPRRQDWDGFLIENGAFWITSRRALLEEGHREPGNIGVYETEQIDIDTYEDFAIAELLMKRRR